MAQPKKQSSPRKTGLRRSHLRLKLARMVNKTSPVKVKTTRQLASFSPIAKNFNKRKNQPNGFEPSSWAYSCTPNIVRI